MWFEVNVHRHPLKFEAFRLWRFSIESHLFLLFGWKEENSRYLWGTFVLLPVFFFSPPECFTSWASIFYSRSSLNFNILSIWYIFFFEIVQYWLKTLLTQCWEIEINQCVPVLKMLRICYGFFKTEVNKTMF